jgi:cytochrome c556
MRRIVTVAAAFVVALGVVAMAQTKITTIDEHVKLMKSNAQSVGAVNKAIAAMMYADARTQLATLRQNFVTLQGFWNERKRDDASKIVKDALTNIDALDKMLAAPTVDQAAAQAAVKTVQGSCGGCHKMYREGDAQSGFKFREGVF